MTFIINGKIIAVSSHYNAVKIYNIFVDVIRLTRYNTAVGFENTEAVLYSNMPAAIRWSRGKEAVRFDKQTWFRDATLRCGYCDINTNDIIRYNGEKFEIVDVVNFRNLSKVLVIDIKRAK